MTTQAGVVRRICRLCGYVQVELDLRAPVRRRWSALRRRLAAVLGRTASQPPRLRCDRCRRAAAVRIRDGLLCARCAVEQLPRQSGERSGAREDEKGS